MRAANAMPWDHGYYSNETYPCGFFREMAPNWLDFAALTRGHTPPRGHEGAPFRYLELGCGMGFGLCLLAALYPEGEFIGVDLLPSHIAHGQALAGDLNLPNLRFLEADLLSLEEDPSPLTTSSGMAGGFHYVAAHGIATWVVESVQAALLSLASRSLRPGGLFYCSYNTYPGWLQRSSFQQLLQLERERCDPFQPSLPVERAVASLRQLLGPSDSPTPLAHGMPQLGEALNTIASQDQNYLNQEYANEGWRPLYVAEMMRRCRQHKLSLLGSATLPELFPQLLPEPVRGMALAEANPLIRETLIDLATMQSFRRDIFIKGPHLLSKGQRDQRLAALTFRRLSNDACHEYGYSCSFGTVVGDLTQHNRAENALSTEPLNFEEWTHAAQVPAEELLLIAALLLHNNRIGLDRNFASPRALEQCISVNLQLTTHMICGTPYQAITAPLIGNAMGFGIIEAMLLQGQLQGVSEQELAKTIQREIQQKGGILRDESQNPILKPAAQLDFLRRAQQTFFAHTLPSLQKVGAFPWD